MVASGRCWMAGWLAAATVLVIASCVYMLLIEIAINLIGPFGDGGWCVNLTKREGDNEW